MSDEVDILNAYTQAPSAYVSRDQDFQGNLPFYKTIEKLINPKAKPMTICDVGCNSGQFLRSLDESWDKFGVEPGSLALQLLEDQSINTHQGTLANSPFPKQSMDYITYFDVFEHLPNPKEEIEIAKSFLKQNGKLAILTGNSTSMTAKAAGPTWTYLSHVGHISVPSEKALTQALSLSGFTKIETLKLSHPYSRSFFDWLILLTLSKILGTPARIKFFNRRWTVPLFQDHMLVIAS
ncbi:class I SAM-dependent methyltransferase [Acaryochloris sp. IP29b_bin.148]|uniref:class I SAM-dependent methyltransferase n=1 Tax=Acaryochloris sp. IP29b_bin.148 TaxID=2969218 RepID=UPI0026375500|nr:class I SAM-dependent methyltransferase [Acaryochloris sp. IP29b_bin.148]